jgi:hypothetical protein
MVSLPDLFERHVEILRRISQFPEVMLSNDSKLRLYSLYSNYNSGLLSDILGINRYGF